MSAPREAVSAAGWHHVHLGSVAPQPWRNGGGTTRELLAWPDAGHWRVRCSVAEVARSGPFSHFEGVARWFAVLAGAGVRLDVDGVAHVLTTDSAPFAFPGHATTLCELLAGPTRDFNLMTRAAPATMVRMHAGETRMAHPGRLIAIFALAPARLASDVDTGTLQADTLAWRHFGTDRPVAVRLEGGPAFWMEISP